MECVAFSVNAYSVVKGVFFYMHLPDLRKKKSKNMRYLLYEVIFIGRKLKIKC